MALLKQSTAYTRAFLLVASADHIAGLTGATPAVNLSKAGGAFAAAGGTITEIANGWYKIALTTTDTNTLGDLAMHITAASGDPTDFADQVVAFDTQDAVRLGLSALPNAAANAVGGLPVLDANSLVDVDVKRWLATAVTAASAGVPDVNTKNLGNTAQTGRDIGASVLLSAGAGTGQLDFTAGVVKANLVQILATALTETAGQIAGAFKKFFNVTSPTLTCLGIDQTGDSFTRIGAAGAGLTGLGDARLAHLDADISSRAAASSLPANFSTLGISVTGHISNVDTLTTYTGNTPQTGDAFARLGAPAGASVSADIASVQTDTSNIKTRLPAALTGAGNMKSDALAINGSATAAANLAIGAAAVVQGTVAAAATTTSIPTSALAPGATVTGQFIGRTLIFDANTASAALQGQATTITASTAGGVLTVNALTTAPAAGDVFAIY